ncbi:MAG: hypothetical protein M3Y87_27860, partial [Myxococcota bacterium]|nr:hypothetical protein [Myxococcota bacterium]
FPAAVRRALAADQPQLALQQPGVVHQALASGAAGRARLERVDLTRTHARYAFTLGAASVEIVLAGRDDAQPALARTRSFNLFYTSARGTEDPEARATLERLLSEVHERVRARDDGSLSLDVRKGLVQLLPPARQRARR